MSIPLYMDENVDGWITDRLREREVDVLTAQADGFDNRPDREVLDRAERLQRLMVTQDKDFFGIAAERQRAAISFVGVIFARQNKALNGEYVNDLELIAKAGALEEFANSLTCLPYR